MTALVCLRRRRVLAGRLTEILDAKLFLYPGGFSAPKLQPCRGRRSGSSFPTAWGLEDDGDVLMLG